MLLWRNSWCRTYCFRWSRFWTQVIQQLRREVLLQEGQRAEGLGSFTLSLLSVDMRQVVSITLQHINSVELLWRKSGKETFTVTGSQTVWVSSRLDLRKVSGPWGKGLSPVASAVVAKLKWEILPSSLLLQLWWWPSQVLRGALPRTYHPFLLPCALILGTVLSLP